MTRDEFRSFEVPPGSYSATTYAVEPDASAASYFFAAAAVTGQGGVPGLGQDSLQGDLGFVRCSRRWDASVRQTETETEVGGREAARHRGRHVELSDTAQTLAAIAPFASSPPA